MNSYEVFRNYQWLGPEINDGEPLPAEAHLYSMKPIAEEFVKKFPLYESYVIFREFQELPLLLTGDDLWEIMKKINTIFNVDVEVVDMNSFIKLVFNILSYLYEKGIKTKQDLEKMLILFDLETYDLDQAYINIMEYLI